MCGSYGGNMKDFSYEELAEFERQFYEFMKSKDFYAEEMYFSNTDIMKGELVKVVMIINGDWKHDHLYSEYLIKQWCEQNNHLIVGSQTNFEEDDGSDCYRAGYTYNIALNKKTGLILVDMLSDKGEDNDGKQN